MPSEINVGGGQYTVKSYSGLSSVPSGTAAGEVINVSAGAGLRVRLDSLFLSTTVQAELYVDNELVIAGDFGAGTSSGSFVVSQAGFGNQTLDHKTLTDVIGQNIKLVTLEELANNLQFSYSVGKS